MKATQRTGQKWLRGKPNAREVFGWQLNKPNPMKNSRKVDQLPKNMDAQTESLKCVQKQAKSKTNAAICLSRVSTSLETGEKVGFMIEFSS